MQRKSVRVYSEDTVLPEERSTILKAAFNAPTAGNQQLFTIIDITDKDIKQSLYELCEKQDDIKKSKLCLVFIADCRKYRLAYEYAGCDIRSAGIGDYLLASADAFLSAMNAVTAANSLGIGSCFIGHITENAEKVKKLLKLPALTVPVALVVFGKPTQEQKDRKKPPRFDEDALVRQNVYSDRTKEEIINDFKRKARQGGKEEYNFCEKLKKMHNRQYDSSFTNEMTRSVSVYFSDFRFEDAN